jgi:hypothetical protein
MNACACCGDKTPTCWSVFVNGLYICHKCNASPDALKRLEGRYSKQRPKGGSWANKVFEKMEA